MVLPWLIALAGGAKFGGDALQDEANRKAKKKASDRQEAAINQAQQEITSGADTSMKYMDEGQSGYESAINQALPGYRPYQQAGETALSKYMGMLTTGAGYTPSPTLNYKAKLLTQYLASRGLSQSDTAQSTGYAPLLNEDYAQQLQYFQPVMQYGYGATGQVSDLYGRIGQSRYNTGTGKADITTGRSTNMVNLITQRGDVQASRILGTVPQTGNIISNMADTALRFVGAGNFNTQTPQVQPQSGNIGTTPNYRTGLITSPVTSFISSGNIGTTPNYRTGQYALRR